ncbi:MAG: response regulator transcription factor [Bacteroidales bacterium]|nr:response regulator transcription factor [Bacteroidales bacterium]
MIKVIAIDDEPLALRQLEMYIDKCPELTLLASSLSAGKVRDIAHDADALFIDINMPDVSGLDFIRSLQNPPIVVFTTAYSQYAVEGFKVDAADYLLKPFSYEEFKGAVAKVKARMEYRSLLASKISDQVITLKVNYKTNAVNVMDITRIEGMREYTKIYLKNEEYPLVVHYSLQYFQDTLPESHFVRIHRSHIVASRFVKEYGCGQVKMADGTVLSVGKLYKESFEQKYLAV